MKQENSGFTLIELMITLAIAAIILAMAMPSFTHVLRDNRLSTTTNNFIAAVNIARSEAAKTADDVELTAIDSSDATNEWGKGGWRVWRDSNDDGDYDAGEEIQVWKSLADNTLDSTVPVTSFVFSSRGRTSATDTLWLCDNRTAETGRKITIHRMGRISVDKDTCS